MKANSRTAFHCNLILLAAAWLATLASLALTQDPPPPERKVGPKGGTSLAAPEHPPTSKSGTTANAKMKSTTAEMKSAKAERDDALANAVKAEVEKNKTVDAAAIKVETKDGVVTLSGKAKSSAEKEAAGRSAMAVKGATVKNEIVVRP